jgi:hypothetical protein
MGLYRGVVPAGYATIAELDARLDRLAARGARVTAIGETVDGRTLHAVEIGARAAPTTAIIAGIHPIEWIGVEVGFALLDRLVAEPPTDRRVVAIPLINRDGYAGVEDDLVRGRRRWRRSNSRGVDLNRNFATHFRRSRPRPTGWNHGGPAPGSEPEIAAVMATLRAAAPDRAVSLHSIGRKILLPWGALFSRPPRWSELRAAGDAIAARLHEPYDVIQSSRWVLGAKAYGMELDWLHGELGALAVLVECTFGGVRLREPRSLLDPFRWFNPPDPERHAPSIAAAVEPFVRGH